MSQNGTYETLEKIASVKGACANEPAGSRSYLQNDAGTNGTVWHKSDTAGSDNVHDLDMENPGALAGATGAVGTDLAITTEDYTARLDAARKLCLAVAECEPEDAAFVISGILERMGRGTPLPAFLSPIEDARWWASCIATPQELKAYCLASFEAMAPKVQTAFIAYVRGRVSE